MKIRKKIWLVLPALVLCFYVANTGCDGEGDNVIPTPPDITKALKLVSFESCDELESEIKQMLVGQMEANLEGYKSWCRYEGGGGGWEEPTTLDGTNDQAEASGASDDRSVDATGTNVQEEGVDEADLIKTDGQFTYAIVEDEVIIAKVWPFGDFDKVAAINVDGEPKGLYLAGDKLIVLSEVSESNNGEGEYEMLDYYMPLPATYTTVEEVYDVSNPGQPKLLKRQTFTGHLLSSRRIDSKLYLIIEGHGVATPNTDYNLDVDYADLPPCSPNGEVSPNQKLLDSIERLKEKNRGIINASTLADLMPDIGDDIACSQIARSTAASGTMLLYVVTDSFADPSLLAAKSAILSNGGVVYASRNALYVTASEMVFGWWGIPEYEFTDSTVIHRFSLDGGIPVYWGSANVAGHLVDNSYAGSRYSARFSMAQFAMSEYEGYLRIATTVTTYGSMSSELDNRVAVLDVSSTSLDQVGEVTGMGRGERIYSVRFIGPRGYVVTFKKVDPLYVLDLSNPAEPQVKGELKIPGFSTYLHPLDDDHIIGLGFEADDMGSFAWTQGLKIALFDVSDPTNPTEVGHREIGTRGSYSAAIEEHHAFTLDRNRGMLSLPVDIYEGGSGGSDIGTHAFSGVILFDVDLSGEFPTIGTIVIDDGSGSESMWWRDSTNVLRTIILGDGVDEGIITLTSTKLYLNRIDEEMGEVGNI
jgi:hypothetical protein